MTPDESQLGVDFRELQLRPGDIVDLAFIQDLDRDGLISDRSLHRREVVVLCARPGESLEIPLYSVISVFLIDGY